MENYAFIEEKLKGIGDDEVKTFNMRLISTSYQMYGVRIPTLRALAKEIAREEGRRFLEYKPSSYEGIMLKGFVLGKLKLDAQTFLAALDELLPYIDNWATCDCIVSSLWCAKKFPRETIEHLWDRPGIFERRVLTVVILDFCLTDERIDFALDRLVEIKQGDYYVDMAIAWTLATAVAKYPQKVLPLADKFPADICKKAAQKMRDSRRVSSEIAAAFVSASGMNR